MLKTPMKMSTAGYAMLKDFEKCVLTAYWDGLGKVWTVGWGATGEGIHDGTTWSQDTADRDLENRMARIEQKLNNFISVPVTQGQFDALCDLAYNAGPAPILTMTLGRKLNMGDYAGASAEFPKWNHSNGQVVAGLTRRRLAEQALFDGNADS